MVNVVAIVSMVIFMAIVAVNVVVIVMQNQLVQILFCIIKKNLLKSTIGKECNLAMSNA